MASSATTQTTTINETATIVARGSKLIDISISGIVAGDVVQFQRSPDAGTNWYAVASYTADTEVVAQNGSIKDCRLKYTTDTGGGTIDMTIRAGNTY